MKSTRLNRCSLAAALLATIGTMCVAAPSQAATRDGGTSAAVAIGIQIAKEAWKAARKLYESHPFVPWQGNQIGLALFYDKGQESRVSYNFSRDPFKLKGDPGRPVKVEFLNVRSSDLNKVSVTVMADKPGRADQPRSSSVGHGGQIRLYDGTSGDRGYYIARLNFPGGRKEFLARNPEAAVKLTILK